MLGVVRFIFRILFRSPPQRPRLSRATVKSKARGADEVRALLHELPEAKIIHVLDGDTLLVAMGPTETRIRLDSIDCPEDGQPWGNYATAGLIKLVGGRRVRVEEHALDFHGRTLATIYVGSANGEEWLNVNEQMVMRGHAWVMRLYYDHLPRDRQTKLNRLEAWAKSKKVGLWRADNPTPPWQWRKRQDELPVKPTAAAPPRFWRHLDKGARPVRNRARPHA